MKNTFFWGVWMLMPALVCAQKMQYVSNRTVDGTNKPAEAPLRQYTLQECHTMPLFGEMSKTMDQIEEEIQFLNVCDQNFNSREEASKFFADRAWDYLNDGEQDTACYRFNLAWLLNKKNAEAYWGLGVICYQKGELTTAERMLRKGVMIDSSNVGLLVDLATVDIVHFDESHDPEELKECDILLRQAQALDSTNANVYLKKALLEYHKGDFDAAWQNCHQVRTLDMSLVDFTFMAKLIAQKPDPLGIFK